MVILVVVAFFILSVGLGFGMGWYVRGAYLPNSRRFTEMFLAKEAQHRETVRGLVDGGIAADARAKAAEERLRDYEDDRRRILAEECAPDERHCACVPDLRAEIGQLRAALKRKDPCDECDAQLAEQCTVCPVLHGVGPLDRMRSALSAKGE